jgi:two-component system, cell cycle response regulator DivK
MAPASLVGSHAILVVEDHKDLRELIVLFVHSRGYEVVQAANGADAIQKAVTTDPTFILLDIRLPDINGVEVARRILALRPDIPIVGWTAEYVSKSYLHNLLQAGFVDCLQKPTSLSEVLKLLEKYAPKSQD